MGRVGNRRALNHVKQMLKGVAWRQVVESWRVEAKSHSKLVEMYMPMEKGCKSRCVEVKCMKKRWIMTKLRGGTAGLEIETGRWRGVSREERSKWRSGRCGAPFVEMYGYGRGEGEADKVDGG